MWLVGVLQGRLCSANFAYANCAYSMVYTGLSVELGWQGPSCRSIEANPRLSNHLHSGVVRGECNMRIAGGLMIVPMLATGQVLALLAGACASGI